MGRSRVALVNYLRSAKQFIVITVFTLLCVASLNAQEGGDRRLRVEVRDETGRPLSHACVTVVPREGDIRFRQCNRKGTVEFKGLTAGSYRVVVKVDGYEVQKREVTLSTKEETVAFSLPPRTKL